MAIQDKCTLNPTRKPMAHFSDLLGTSWRHPDRMVILAGRLPYGLNYTRRVISGAQFCWGRAGDIERMRVN